MIFRNDIPDNISDTSQSLLQSPIAIGIEIKSINVYNDGIVKLDVMEIITE